MFTAGVDETLMSESSNALNAINQRIVNCPLSDRCTTLGRRHFDGMYIHPSPGYIGTEYDPDKDLLFIAQNPGVPCNTQYDKEQYQQNLTFDQRMSAYATALRHYHMVAALVDQLDIQWSHMAWLNVVKCPTISNSFITHDEYALCVPYLRAQLSCISPRVCVAIGSLAAKAFNSSTLCGVARTLNGYVIYVPHYSHVNHVSWIKTLKEYISTVNTSLIMEKC